MKLEKLDGWQIIRVLCEAGESGMDSVTTIASETYMHWMKWSILILGKITDSSLLCSLEATYSKPGEAWTQLMSRYKRMRTTNKVFLSRAATFMMCFWAKTLNFKTPYLKSEFVTTYLYLWIDADNYQTVSLESFWLMDNDLVTASWLIAIIIRHPKISWILISDMLKCEEELVCLELIKWELCVKYKIQPLLSLSSSSSWFKRTPSLP